jgi:hypothetical protein
MLPLQLLVFHAAKRYISSNLCVNGLPRKTAVGAPLIPQFGLFTAHIYLIEEFEHYLSHPFLNYLIFSANKLS